MGLLNETNEQYYHGSDGVWKSGDENYGSYQFITINDIINNFIVAYVGEGKLISKVKRTDVAFHAQRALQELSFDTLPSTKAIEVEVGPALQIILPQDYVNYIRFSWTDGKGTERLIHPTRNTSNPTAYLQDADFKYIFDANQEVMRAQDSTTWERFKGTDTTAVEGDLSTTELFNLYRYGNRYGLSPEHAQSNGVFYIDQNRGVAHFSSNLANQLVTLKYVSDGLAVDGDMQVHKFAEEAMYRYIAHAILATRINTPEYIVNRFKKEAFAAKRVAKLRMSNLKIEEIAQVLRNQSKWIKH